MFCQGDVTYAIPKLESASTCHEIPSVINAKLTKYICYKLIPTSLAKLICVKIQIQMVPNGR